MQCQACKSDFPEDRFPIDTRKKDGSRRRTTCKPCVLQYQKEHYRRSPKRRADIYAANAICRARSQAFILEYLSTHPCVDCGEADIVVLEFDHRDRALKTHAISMMVQRATSTKRIAEEIAKCDVRCANCHRRRTAKQLGWFRHLRV